MEDSVYSARFFYFVRIIQSALNVTDDSKFVGVLNVGETCNSVIKFSLLLLADQKPLFGLPPSLFRKHHWFVNIFYITAY
jgi:hypothetical protein